MEGRSFPRWQLALAATVATLSVLGGTAYATLVAPTPSTIHACAKRTDGKLRVVSGSGGAAPANARSDGTSEVRWVHADFSARVGSPARPGLPALPAPPARPGRRVQPVRRDCRVRPGRRVQPVRRDRRVRPDLPGRSRSTTTRAASPIRRQGSTACPTASIPARSPAIRVFGSSVEACRRRPETSGSTTRIRATGAARAARPRGQARSSTPARRRNRSRSTRSARIRSDSSTGRVS